MRMSGSPYWTRGGAAGKPTHALFADRSHSFPDNVVALLGYIRAWNCSAEPARSAVCEYSSVRLKDWSGAAVLPLLVHRSLTEGFLIFCGIMHLANGGMEIALRQG